jgi:type IV pilus assembly protein PilW
MIYRIHTSRSPVHQRGLSLIELMIGIALSLLILTAVLYSFAGSRASYQHQTSFSAVQESGRIALELLNRDLRMAGNPGCGNINFLDHRTPLLYSNDVVVETAPGVGASPDSITIRYGSAAVANVAISPADNQFELVSAAPLGVIVAGDRLLLSDCSATEVITVAGVPPAPVTGNLITATANLSQRFRSGSEVMRLETVVYTVGGNELRRNGQAIAAGVTNMQLLYGISSPADRSALAYIDSPAVAAAARAVSVRLALTVADGPDVSQTFSSTVALRNRAP